MPIEIVDSMPRTGTKGWMLVDVARDSEGHITSETVVSWKTYKGKPAARDALWNMSQPKRTVIGEEMTVFHLTTEELDAFIRQQYNQPNWCSYESEHDTRYDDMGDKVDGDGWNEGDLILIEISDSVWVIDQGLLNNFLQGHLWEGTTKTLLNDLCRRDIIPAGSYLIRVIKPKRFG